MTAWLAGNLLWTSAALLLVLAVRRPVAWLFGAGAAYALWLLPALRVFLPPLPPLGAALPEMVPTVEIALTLEAAADGAASSGGGGWMALLLALWAAGGLVFIVWQWRVYRAFLTRQGRGSRSLGEHDGILLVESPSAEGPVAVGLLDPRIIVPVDFARRYSPEERRLALAHEAVHHRRGDIWANLAALLVLALNWFNPLAWLAFRAFREDQELACDAAVAGGAGPETRETYARAMIKSASRPGLIAACPLNHADQLKRRLKMMKHHRRSRLRLLGGAAAVTILAGITAALGTPGIAHPHPEGEEGSGAHGERVVIMKHKDARGEHSERRIRIQPGTDPESMVEGHCPEAQATRIDAGEGQERTRIVLCLPAETTSAERVEHLQRVRADVADEEHLNAERRALVTAAIDREIARLQAR